MNPYYHNDRMTLYQGDVRQVLAALEPESVQTCITSPPYWALRSYLDNGHDSKHLEIGSEATPDEYVQTMVQVFREVRRVLRSDGVCWINLGDSYAAHGAGADGKELAYMGDAITGRQARTAPPGLKAKDLCMIPARVALALQADGWWLRSEITWCKRAPMPESVTDRPTSATEKIYLLTKQERYFYDSEAVRVSSSGSYNGSTFTNGKTSVPHENVGQGERTERPGRNLWNYWLLNPESFSDAHFATFPTKLVEPCVLAGTSEKGCCPECGAPWARVVEKSTHFEGGSGKAGRTAEQVNSSGKWAGKQYGDNIKLGPVVSVETKGWQPTCKHGHEPVPCVVLDPFNGAGTSGLVALRHNRRYVGIDLSSDYLDMSVKRIQGDARANQMHMELAV